MTGEIVLYRADIRGLKPGDATRRMVASYDGREYTYATTNLDVARAFGVFAWGAPRNDERSVYRVELDDPIVEDPEFLPDQNAWFLMSHWGTVLDVVEDPVTMTVDQARQVMARYAYWIDGSPAFDDDGYATVPPKWRNESKFDVEEIRLAVRELGLCPDPHDVVNLLADRYK